MWCDAQGAILSKAGANTGPRVPSKHESQSVCVCLARSPAVGWLMRPTLGLVVGNGVTPAKTRGTWGRAQGVDEVQTGRPRSASLGLTASLLVAGLRPTCTGTILGRKVPQGGHLLEHRTGYRPGQAQPSTRPPLPLAGSRRASRPPPPLPSPSFRAAAGRGGLGAGRAALPRFGFRRQQPQQNSGGSARLERARAPLPRGAGAAETRQTRALNDSAVGDCAARDAPRHCRFKHACPLFGIEPMSERPLPALSQ